MMTILLTYSLKEKETQQLRHVRSSANEAQDTIGLEAPGITYRSSIFLPIHLSQPLRSTDSVALIIAISQTITCPIT